MSAPQTPHTTGPLQLAGAVVADHSRVFGPKWCPGLIDSSPMLVRARLIAVQLVDFYPKERVVRRSSAAAGRDRAGDAGGQG